ncbi:MAG: alpha/beta hydrolase [Firmicutes bacterium]|nr:alpha/beta hydrolase [Bacillota bacterium]
MRHEEMQWVSNDGLKLFAQKWEPQDEAKAVISLVHGHGEHSGRYSHWAEKLNSVGYAVLASDLRGHGRSEGQRGDCPSFDHYADDVTILLEKTEEIFSGKPIFLYGHSLGGLIVLFTLIQRHPQIKGAVVTSPVLQTAIVEQKAKMAAAKILGSIMPKATLPSGLEQEALSRDPLVIEAYRNDPLVHNKGSLRMAKQMLATMEYVLDRGAEIDIPMLLMHGTGDKITYAAGCEQLNKVMGGDCTLKLYDDYYHELHNEPEKDKVFEFLREWLDRKL